MPFAQLGDFEEAERLYLRVHAEQARHACADPQIANCPRACAEGPLTASRRSKAAALGEDHEATLRTRMGLVNVLAETGRPEMVEEICRRVEGVGCTPAERSAPRVLISTFSCGEAIGMFGIETTL